MITFGDYAVLDEFTNQLFAELPIELWITGDLKWIVAAFAKEWSIPNQDQCANNGAYWTSELLHNFADGVHSGRLKTSSQWKGVVTDAAIEYVGPD